MIKLIQNVVGKALIALCILCLYSCISQSEKEKIRIAFNPWPGYEFLYLAQQKGFFKAQGLDIEMVPVASLSDSLRAFSNGKVNGMCSTMSEVVRAVVDHKIQLVPLLVTDYSSGSDVIIARKEIKSLSDLKGQPIGMERDSLGAFMLYRALEKSGMKFSEIVGVQAEQVEGQHLLETQVIKAFISYPPVSLVMLKNPDYHVIFDSSKIPKEVVDIVTIKKDQVKDVSGFVQKFHIAWNQAVAYYHQNQQEAAALMAARENIPAQQFISALSDMIVVTKEEQINILSKPTLLSNALTHCKLIYGERFARCQIFDEYINIVAVP